MTNTYAKLETALVRRMYSNQEATLHLHRQALKSVCADYVIRFTKQQRNIEKIIPLACDIVSQLIEDYRKSGKTVKGRLVALVHYTRETTGDEVKAYHTSYQSEVIENGEDFFIPHMLKIAERMSTYNQKGSNLTIERISEIHLHITCSRP